MLPAGLWICVDVVEVFSGGIDEFNECQMTRQTFTHSVCLGDAAINVSEGSSH